MQANMTSSTRADMRLDRLGRAQRRLVGAHDLGDREPRLAAAREKFGAGAEGIGDVGVALGRRLVAAPSRTMKPPPTESQVSSASVAPAASRATRRSVFGMARRRRRRRRRRSHVAGSKRIDAPPGERQALRRRARRRRARRPRPGRRSPASRPERPRTTALSVAWPRPVKASEPSSVTSTLATRASAPARARPAAKAAAAFIGPTVCDDDGPTPILKSSKTLIMARRSREGHARARGLLMRRQILIRPYRPPSLGRGRGRPLHREREAAKRLGDCSLARS